MCLKGKIWNVMQIKFLGCHSKIKRGEDQLNSFLHFTSSIVPCMSKSILIQSAFAISKASAYDSLLEQQNYVT